jgi:type IV secretion system protein VirB8
MSQLLEAPKPDVPEPPKPNTPFPGFVYVEKLIAEAKEHQSYVALRDRRSRRSLWGYRLYSGMMTILCFLLGGALNYAIPLVRVVPVMFYQRPDGLVETALTTESLPADLSDANIKAWLWQYVMHRESYSWVEADYNHYLVGAMSDVPVRAAYDAYMNGKNKESPLVVYNTRGTIRVALREVTEWKRSYEGQPGVITFHFDRYVTMEGAPKQPVETWTVTLQFIQDYNQGFTVQDIKSFNPSRIVVTSYPGSVKLPATPQVTP